MTKKVEPWDDNWSVSEAWSNFSREENEFGWWTDGSITTKYGIVSAYQQEDHTDIRFVWEGRCYNRSWPTAYSQQWVVTLAKRFVREITGHEKVG